MEKRLRMVIPKGSLERGSIEILQKAFYRVEGYERSYTPIVSDREIELRILRPQEIPVYIAEGLFDLGITGRDWVEETGVDVKVLRDLEFGRVKLVFAAPAASRYKSLDHFLEERLSRGESVKIATEYLNITTAWVMGTRAYSERLGSRRPTVITPWYKFGDSPQVSILLSFGATEAKPPIAADAVVDNLETGRTLEQNNLAVVEELMESSALLVANKEALEDEWKREKIYDILTMFTGVLESEKKLHIFLNVKEENLEELLATLPALKSPTINRLSMEGWFAVNTVIDKSELHRILPKLRRLAQGLVAHKPELILPLEEIGRGSDKNLERKRS
ncbi:MAG: ATP phosphoribosyltransferase [Nitrososphaerota archaeon]|nr:ATP phosphoribosyltransferase [Candidatus Calditenuaceae archaeon]MDW8073095.1 ATP phosphoribosyltransferase [Nitrososphaerota archaeon]